MEAVLVLAGVPMAFAVVALIRMRADHAIGTALCGGLIVGMLVILYAAIRVVRRIEDSA